MKLPISQKNNSCAERAGLPAFISYVTALFFFKRQFNMLLCSMNILRISPMALRTPTN